MKKLNTLLFCLLIVVLSSCSQKQEETLDKYKWLIGSWIAVPTPGGEEFNERWYKESDVKYMGEAWILESNGDTAFTEKLWLELVNDTLYYKAKISETYTAVFATTKMEENTFEVNFPENDFPAVIKYEKVGDDKFIATLSGTTRQGEPVKEVLEFVKR